MKPALRSLSVALVLLTFAFLSLAQKKGGGGGGGSTPPPPADPAIVYRNMGGDAYIHVANADGSNNVTVVHRGSTPSWGPSGEGTSANPHRFVCTDFTETQLLTYKVWVDATGTRSAPDQVLLVGGESDIVATPVWSGTRIAYALKKDSSSFFTIQVIDAAGGGLPAQVYEADPGMGIWDLSWFSDGVRLAFTEQEQGNQATSRIRILNTANGEVTDALPAGIVGPLGGISMGRTKDVVVFHARLSANTNDWKFYLHTLDLSTPGAQPVRLVLGLHPAWSPDDKKILFRDNRDNLSALTLSTGNTTSIAPMGISPDWRR